MEDRQDRVVVIGAGIGGLAAALRLAHAGRDVVVVDQHPGPGGKMRTVDSAAGPVDAGPTVLTLRCVFDDLFADVGESLDAHLELAADEVLARHYWPDGSTLDLFADVEASAAAVSAFAGARAGSDFRRFSAAAARLYAAFDRSMMRAARPRAADLARGAAGDPATWAALLPGRSLSHFLASQFRDARLRQLFGRYATYVGGSPYASPAVLGLIWHAEASGVWAVRGGMHRLARAVEALARARGASFRYGDRASRIEVQNGRASAVQLASGARLTCDAVVFNGDPRALRLGLLGPAVRGAVTAKATEPRSLSAYVWAFAARPSGPPLAHHTVFFGTDPRAEFDPLAAGLMPDDPTLYICAQDRGGGARPEGTERFEIIMNGPPGGAGGRGEAEECQTRTFRRLRDFGLTFDPEPRIAALTMPTGFDSLFPGSSGSLYGRSPHGLMAPFHRPTARSALPGLYLAGGGVHPGAGVPMAALSGRHAAEAILTDRASTSRSRRTATRGGTSTASRTTALAPFR